MDCALISVSQEPLLQPLVDLDHDFLRPVVLLGFLLAEQLFQPRLKACAHVLGRLRGGEQLFQRRPRRLNPRAALLSSR